MPSSAARGAAFRGLAWRDRSGPAAGPCRRSVTPSGLRTTKSGRSVSPCSAMVALSVWGMFCPSASTSSGSPRVCLSTKLIHALWMAGFGRSPCWLSSHSSKASFKQASVVRVMGIEPLGNTFSSTGTERNGPETSISESHSSWWREEGMVTQIASSRSCRSGSSLHPAGLRTGTSPGWNENPALDM